MANPTRQARRANEREAAKRAKKGQGHVARPTGQTGFEVDRVGDRVVATFFSGYQSCTLDLAPIDGTRIGELLIEASADNGATAQAPEVVGSSGLVIARTLPEGGGRT